MLDSYIKSYSINIFCLVTGLLIISCAQVASPEGGPKDVTPPKIEKSIPRNFATSYPGRSVLLVFDEFVQVRDASKEIIVSPPLGNPEITLTGKTVELKFDSIPEPNTTYSINLGKAIVDVNEGNVLDSNLFVFSTGDVLDTLMFSGVIKNAFDQTPQQDIYAFLYKSLNDSAPYKSRPYYLAKTDEQGEFRISHIKQGTYSAFALKDVNNNFIYDQPGELIAFSDSPVVIRQNVADTFLLFEEESSRQYLKYSQSPQPGKITLAFAKPADSLEITPLRTAVTDDIFIKEIHAADSFSLWVKDTLLDTLALVVRDGDFADTVEVRLAKKTGILKAKGRGAVVFKLTAETNADTARPLSPRDTLTLTFSHPVARFDTSLVLLREEERLINYNTAFKDSVRRSIQLLYPWREDSLYHLFLPPGAVTDIFGLTNDTLQASFKKQKQEYYGSLRLKITVAGSPPGQFILILKDEKGRAVKEQIITASEKAVFNYLAPGNYSLLLIFDENKNGKWDTGNYLQKKQPERVTHYTGKVTVRSNWEQELEWQVE